jgi:ABC-2 type transport system ATP-binding protein
MTSDEAGRDTRDVVRLERVFARDESGSRGRPLGHLQGLFWSIGAGLHGVIGRPEDGTVALCEVLAGFRAPRAGAVRIDGRDPFTSPTVRRSIASLLPRAELVGRSVDDAVRAAVEVRGGADPLARFGLAAMGSRSLASLSAEEARAVELALALATPEPRACVLYEPFAMVAGIDRVAVRERLTELRISAAVVIVTAAAADAVSLADRIFVLEKGRWLSADVGSGWPSRASGEIIVWLDDGDGSRAAELCAALSLDEREGKRELTGVSWHHAPERSGISSVTVRGHDLDEVARIVAKTCTRLGSPVRVVHSPPLDVDQLIARASLRASIGGVA